MITRIELLGYSDINNEDEAFLQTILDAIASLPLSNAVEQETIALRKQHKIKLPDAIILATAHVHKLQLLTLDKRLMQYTN